MMDQASNLKSRILAEDKGYVSLSYGVSRNRKTDKTALFDQVAKSKKSRGNLPREAVNYFMAWLYENRFRAYPCEETKKRMARDTGLTLQQVNNWYINARRRILPSLISKEGKEPRDYRITRKRINTATMIVPNDRAHHTNLSTDFIAPLAQSRSHCLNFTSLSPTDPKNNASIPSLLSNNTYACSCVAPVSPIPQAAGPSTMPQFGRHIYNHAEYLFDSSSNNHAMSSINKSITDTEAFRLTKFSCGVLTNNYVTQPQPEPSLNLHDTSLYGYYNLKSNNNGELGDILPQVENLVNTTCGSTDENFRTLEFNMI